jgi:hypothetical protein
LIGFLTWLDRLGKLRRHALRYPVRKLLPDERAAILKRDFLGDFVEPLERVFDIQRLPRASRAYERSFYSLECAVDLRQDSLDMRSEKLKSLPCLLRHPPASEAFGFFRELLRQVIPELVELLSKKLR